MKLHVLTAVSRPHNLAQIAQTIAFALAKASSVDLTWHCRFDSLREHVGGQALKNAMLDGISDGWIAILDDDTTMHPQFLRVIEQTYKQNPTLMAIVVSQKRTTGQVLVAAPENAVIGSIDAGQIVIRRSFIGNYRLPETYAGDGEWLQTLLLDNKDVAYLKQVLSRHNQLSGIDVSESPERMHA